MSNFIIIIKYSNIKIRDDRTLTINVYCDGLDQALHIAAKEVKKLFAYNKHEVFDVKVDFDFST
jgi:hypothetical protein